MRILEAGNSSSRADFHEMDDSGGHFDGHQATIGGERDREGREVEDVSRQPARRECLEVPEADFVAAADQQLPGIGREIDVVRVRRFRRPLMSHFSALRVPKPDAAGVPAGRGGPTAVFTEGHLIGVDV